jgi:hypothetical protein
MSESDEDRDLEDELLACLESESEDEETDVPKSHTLAVSKWERFVHLGEDVTTRIFMVNTMETPYIVLQ